MIALIYIIKCLLIIVYVLLMVAFYTILERKIIAYMQRRRGPNLVGPFGLLQAIADSLKLLVKKPIQNNNDIFVTVTSNSNLLYLQNNIDYKNKKLYKQQTRKFSSQPRMLFQKTKNKINDIMQIFIKNKNKQQEIFLGFYVNFLLCFFCYAYLNDLNSVFFSIFIIMFLILFILLSLKCINFLISFKDFQIYKFIVIFLGFLVLLYFQFYTYCIFIFFIYVFSFLKSKVPPTSSITTILKDVEIANNHFKVDFPLFHFLRIFNIFLFVLLLNFFTLLPKYFLDIININPTLFTTTAYILFLILVFNFIIILGIQFIIIFFCNPITAGKVVQACITCAGTGISTYLAYLGFHHGCTTPYVNPPRFQFVYDYQKEVLEYSSKDGVGIALGESYKTTVSELPPTDEFGFIDKEKTREKLKAFVNDEVRKNTTIATTAAINTILPFDLLKKSS